MKYDAGCVGLTPPNCPELATAHNDVDEHAHAQHNELRRARSTLDSRTMDVFTPQLHIVEHLPHCPDPSVQLVPSIYYFLVAALTTSLNAILFAITITLFLRSRSGRNEKL
ncbi:unnamed protein product [Gongylonema pulchrum]|uniref:Uncharacterized protein n=1 Tax=Gongylonema pulchrum TaxID=637853 RepID=A0A3P6Q5T8_9BILA|nr:unnamed protein product [Gongylonema pulchrum]